MIIAVSSLKELTAMQAIFDRGVNQVQLEIIELESCAEMAVEVSLYTIRDASQRVVDKGKYIAIWKQHDGRWKLHRDIFNSSLLI